MLNPMAHAMPNNNTLIMLKKIFCTPCQRVVIPDASSGFTTLALVAFTRLPPPRRIA
jgi:hypothetical protein